MRYRGADGECFDRPVAPMAAAAADRGQEGRQGQRRTAQQRRRPRSICARSATKSSPRSTARCPTRRPMNWRGVMACERIALAEFSADRRHHRPVPHRRPAVRSRRCSREFAADGSVRSVQLEFPLLPAGPEDARRPRATPRNMRVAKLRLPRGAYARPRHERHHRRDRFRYRRQTSRTRRIRSPTVSTRSAASEGPHVHGTGIAGAIVAHARLMGSAPAAQDCSRSARSARRRSGAESTSYVILKGLDLRGRAWRADHQYELCRPEGSADRARHRRDGGQGHRDGRRRRQCRARNRRRSIPPPIRM